MPTRMQPLGRDTSESEGLFVLFGPSLGFVYHSPSLLLGTFIIWPGEYGQDIASCAL